MKLRLPRIFAALVPAALLAFAHTALAASSARFTHMDVAITSHSHGKAADTGLEFLIQPVGGGAPVGYLSVQGQEFSSGSTVAEFVPSAGSGFTLGDLGHEALMIRVSPKGAGAWTCGMDIVLHFDDGSQALLSSGDLSLSASRPSASLDLSLATVAKPGIFGGMAKLAFKLTSKTVDGAEAPVSAPGAGGVAAAQAPASRTKPKEFTHMDVALYTHGHGKPPEARLELFVAKGPKEVPVAYLDLPSTRLSPGSTTQETVSSSGPGFTLGDLRDEQIFVRITSPTPVHWTFGYDVILHFGDGTQALLSSGDSSLSGISDAVAVPLSLSTVAHPSILGGFQKLAFEAMGGRKVNQTDAPEKEAPAAASAPAASPPSAQDLVRSRFGTKAFMQMDVTINTGAHGKAASVPCEISLLPVNGGPSEAYLGVRDTEFKPNTSETEVVPASGPAFTPQDLKDRQVLVKLSPSGPMTWTCTMDLVVRFGDGTQVLWSTGKLSLSDRNPQATISMADAFVAKKGLIGGAEKIGFGILNALHN